MRASDPSSSLICYIEQDYSFFGLVNIIPRVTNAIAIHGIGRVACARTADKSSGGFIAIKYHDFCNEYIPIPSTSRREFKFAHLRWGE